LAGKSASSSVSFFTFSGTIDLCLVGGNLGTHITDSDHGYAIVPPTRPMSALALALALARAKPTEQPQLKTVIRIGYKDRAAKWRIDCAGRRVWRSEIHQWPPQFPKTL
jgi:hypothetical protein